jgi:hypothetical protein
MQRSRSVLSTVVVLAASLCAAPRVEAKGGSPVTVTITGAVSGTLVEGVVTIANGSSKALTVASITGGLEVRYPTGSPAPALPPGQTSGYYTVASAALPPPASIPALGTVTVPYSTDVCSGAVADYRGAKDMRSVASWSRRRQRGGTLGELRGALASRLSGMRQ